MSLKVQVRRLGTPTQALIENLALNVAPGVVHTVMGPSGCGKSSLLAAVCGTLAEGMHFDGEIHLNGNNLSHWPTERRQIGILFQEDLLFAHMTVFENLLFAVHPGPRKQREAAVNQGLADLEMTHFAHADPATLSGGQRGRVALMRALLAQPKALLLDEPFAKLDTDLRARMRSFVFGQVAQRQLPVLLVTHDASDIADPAHVTHLMNLNHGTRLTRPAG